MVRYEGPLLRVKKDVVVVVHYLRSDTMSTCVASSISAANIVKA